MLVLLLLLLFFPFRCQQQQQLAANFSISLQERPFLPPLSKVLGVGVSSLREDPDYIRFYINWTRLLTTGLAPMAALVFFNWNIFRGIRMTHERTRRRNKQKAGEMNLAAILLCIVVVFTICHSPRVMLNVHEFFMLDDMLRCGASELLDLLFCVHLFWTFSSYSIFA